MFYSKDLYDTDVVFNSHADLVVPLTNQNLTLVVSIICVVMKRNFQFMLSVQLLDTAGRILEQKAKADVEGFRANMN